MTKDRRYVHWTEVITCVDVDDRKARRVCRQCETPLSGRRTVYCTTACEKEFDRNHFRDYAFKACMERAQKACERAGDHRGGLEVNHIEPVRGGPRYATCLNHQANLEVLCHGHHIETTELQFRPEKAARRRMQPDLAPPPTVVGL